MISEIYEKLFVVLWAATQKDAWDPRYTIMINTMGQKIPESLKILSSVHSHQPPVRVYI